jgi:hypothetical protein
MPVWRQRRRRFLVEFEPPRLDLPVKVLVREPKPGEPNERILVHLRQGELDWLVEPDATGLATFRLDPEGGEDVKLTVSGADAIPLVRELRVEAPSWIIGRVTEVSHRHGGRNETRVVLETEGGVRQCRVSGDDPDYAVIVEAIVEAHTSGSPIRVFATRKGAIERFRFAPDDGARERPS